MVICVAVMPGADAVRAALELPELELPERGAQVAGDVVREGTVGAAQQQRQEAAGAAVAVQRDGHVDVVEERPQGR